MNSNKILSPKLDVVFQILFGEVGSENITKDFLNSMLDEKINEINLNENIVLRRENIEDKMGIVDVLAKIILTEHLEIHIIELPKIYKRADNEKDTKLIEWLSFLENPESEEVLYYMENNKNIKSAKERLTTLSDDERVRRLAELREKALMDEREARYTGYTEGHKQGFEDGKGKGIEEGIREGIREGKEEEKREIARKMKEEKFDLETILKLTGLTKEVIESL